MEKNSIMHKNDTEAIAPEKGLLILHEGNQRYVSGRSLHPRQESARRDELVAGQHPFAIVVACSDSRVPVELIFDCGLGDLFVIRTAGHMLDEAALASAQYATEHLGCQLLVVLGHSNCGAVQSVVSGAHADGHLGRALGKLQPIVAVAAARGGNIMEAAVNVNIENAVNTIKTSAWARPLRVVGMRYELAGGQVVAVC